MGYGRFVFPKKKPDRGSPSINSSAGIETQVKGGGESWGWRHELSLSLSLLCFLPLMVSFSLDLLNVSDSVLVEFAKRTRGKPVTAIRV